MLSFAVFDESVCFSRFFSVDGFSLGGGSESESQFASVCTVQCEEQLRGGCGDAPDGITCDSFCADKEAELDGVGCTAQGTALVVCLGEIDDQCMIPNDACTSEKTAFEECAKRLLGQ